MNNTKTTLFGAGIFIVIIIVMFFSGLACVHLFPGIFTQDSQSNITDWANLAVTALGLLVSTLGFYYVIITFRKDIEMRNLNYVAELDKLLIEYPELWEFFDEHRQNPKARIEFIKNNCDLYAYNDTIELSGGQNTIIDKLQGNIFVRINDIPVSIPYKVETNDRLLLHIEGDARISHISSEALIRFKSDSARAADHRLRGLVYYKLNHYESFIQQKNSMEGWNGYMKYNLKHSTLFRESLEKILRSRYGRNKGLYTLDTYEIFRKIYNEHAKENDLPEIL